MEKPSVHPEAGSQHSDAAQQFAEFLSRLPEPELLRLAADRELIVFDLLNTFSQTEMALRTSEQVATVFHTSSAHGAEIDQGVEAIVAKGVKTFGTRAQEEMAILKETERRCEERLRHSRKTIAKLERVLHWCRRNTR